MKRSVLIISAVVIISVTALVWMLDIPNWKKLDISKIRNTPRSSVIYDRNGEPVGSVFSSENRIYRKLDELPLHVAEAFIAAEDARFFKHHGVDPKRIAGALWNDIKTLSFTQGASTITQQLIKLTHLSNEKTLSRKAQEAYLAIKLERKLDKNSILEAYINTVYFGSGAYGIESASVMFLGKSADELNISEAAYLAGIIKSPSGYSPFNHHDRTLKRREYVLTAMHDNGFINDNDYEMALSYEPSIAAKQNSLNYGWYIDEVSREARIALDISVDTLFSGGYRIYTGLDPYMQKAAEKTMNNGDIYPEPAAQGALAAIDPASGELMAIVGGREYSVRMGLNRASMSYRQVGSTIKPLSTYAAAVDKYGYLPTSMVFDVKREYNGGYSPGNSGSTYYGSVTLRTALAKSLNAATVDLADTLGTGQICDYARKFGIPVSHEDENLAFALGSSSRGVSPVQLCAAYGAIANGGIYHKAHAIRYILDCEGNLIYTADASASRAVSPESACILSDILRTAADSGTAKALRGIGFPVAAKTGTAGLENGDTSDAWTTAFTPDIAVTVWMGLDSNSNGGMARSVSGGGYAAPACASFLKAVSDRLSKADFDTPKTLQRVLVDGYLLSNENRVALATADTPVAYTTYELFPRDDMPDAYSNIWGVPEAVTELSIDHNSGRDMLTFRATDDHSEYLILKRKENDVEIAAVLDGDSGEIIQYQCESGYDYSILPRNKLLREEGKDIVGEQSRWITVSAMAIPLY